MWPLAKTETFCFIKKELFSEPEKNIIERMPAQPLIWCSQ